MMTKILAACATLAAVLWFVPPAHALGPLQAITVGPNTTGGHLIDLASKGAVTVAMAGIPASCASATGVASVAASSPASNPFMTITGTTFASCVGPFGIPVSVTQRSGCVMTVTYDGTPVVDVTLTDNVDGTLNVNNCLTVSGTGCTMDVVGSVDADFDETVKSTPPTALPSVQDLTISGAGLVSANTNCFPLSDGASIVFNLKFNVASANGPINFS